MTRWIACCFVAAALWAGPAAADCPVLFKGNHALPVGQPVGTWQAAHAAVKGAPVADEAAAQKALCAPGVPCGGAGPVHVLDRDQLT